MLYPKYRHVSLYHFDWNTPNDCDQMDDVACLTFSRPEIPTTLRMCIVVSVGSCLRPLTQFYPQIIRAEAGRSPASISVGRVLPFVSQQLHPAREDVDRADHIGVVLKPTFHALEPGLRRSVVRRDMTAARAGAARVLRWHHNETAAVPR